MTIEDIQFPTTPFPLQESLILLGRRGSEAHGTYVPPTEPDAIDDRDLMGICIPPARYYFGLSQWEGAEAMNGCWDVVLYEFRKFIRLLMKQNPNVLGMLWLEPDDYLLRTPVGNELIAARDLFRERRAAAASFSGYAMSQLKKMRSNEFHGYMGAKRKALVERYGFDCKNAAHLVRLLHMGIEYQRTGRLQVRRTLDREMLIDIKKGCWSIDRVQSYADEQLAEIEKAAADSVLPESIDQETVEKLVMRLFRSWR